MGAEFSAPVPDEDVGAYIARSEGRGGGRRAGGERQRRLHGEQHERPRGGHAENRQREPGLLPARLRPDEQGPGRSLPQDRGQAGQSRRPASPCAQGLLRVERQRQGRARGQEGRRLGVPGRVRLALGRGRPLAAHDRLRRRREDARQGERPDRGRARHSRGAAPGEGRTQLRRRGLLARRRAPPDGRVLPLRPDLQPRPATRHPRAGREAVDADRARLRPRPRGLPGQGRRARQGQRPGRVPDARVPRAAARGLPRLDAGAERHPGHDARGAGRAGRRALRCWRVGSSRPTRASCATSRCTGRRRTRRRGCRPSCTASWSGVPTAASSAACPRPRSSRTREETSRGSSASRWPAHLPASTRS